MNCKLEALKEEVDIERRKRKEMEDQLLSSAAKCQSLEAMLQCVEEEHVSSEFPISSCAIIVLTWKLIRPSTNMRSLGAR
mmetsp:Transcript_46214/g.119102  ORF Transcript_46214/g.119102 Transcript_46214/m.119102 type:complete len:80 (+) Transcript_46214:379-618(+)